MGTAEIAIKIAAFGAIGVAIFALYVWHSAYRHLLDSTKGGGAQTEVVERLAAQLQQYSKLALLTLILAVGLQVVELVVDKIWLKSVAHSVRLNVTPDDIWTEPKKPNVLLNGKPMASVGVGSFEELIRTPSNLEVSILPIRDALQEERRNLSRALTEQAKSSGNQSASQSTSSEIPNFGY